MNTGEEIRMRFRYLTVGTILGGLAMAAPLFAQREFKDSFSPLEMVGVAYFREANCQVCHGIDGQGTANGPDLTRPAARKDAAWMIGHFKTTAATRPGGSAPIRLTDSQLYLLASFLLKLNPQIATAIENAPDFATKGALAYQVNHCGDCHQVNGTGMGIGPSLNGLSKRQTRSWVEEHFANPQKFSPESIMPPYSLSPKDMENLVAYLFSLPD